MTNYNAAINYDSAINYDGVVSAPVQIGGPTRKKLKATGSMSVGELNAEIEAAIERKARRDDEEAFILIFD